MEVRFVYFLFLVCLALSLNTAIIFAAYRLFAGMAGKATETITEVQRSAELREWIGSLRVAAERAAVMTEAAKLKLREFDPALDRAHEKYRHALGKIDSKLDQTAEKINTAARDMRDVVSKPAFAVATFAAGVTRALVNEDEEPEE